MNEKTKAEIIAILDECVAQQRAKIAAAQKEIRIYEKFREVVDRA